MKKTKIVLTILLIALVATFAALGSISAESTDVSIDYINISHNLGSIRLYYAVSAEGLPEGATLGVDARVGSPDSTELRVAENQGVTVIDGKEYTVFGLPVYADELTVDFYATPYLLQDGVRTDFALAKDSIIEYAVKKKAEIGDEQDQVYKLIDSLLEYGACVQDYFGKNTERPANLDYHKITLVDGKFADGFDHGYFFEGETVTTAAVVKPGYAVEKWVDFGGNTVSESATLDIVAGSTDATYTAVLVKTGDNISYDLDGGTLPEGEWTKYPEDRDFTLPVPTKAGHIFTGWYTEEGYGISRIPAGSEDYFLLKAGWSKTVYDKSAEALYDGIKRLSIDNYDDNGLTVVDNNLVWTQGTTAISQITVNGNLKSLLDGEKVFTLVLDLALAKDTPCFSSTFRFRHSGGMVNFMRTNTSGEVLLGASGPAVARLTETAQRIAICVDFENLTLTAYSEVGKEIATTKLALPSGYTGDTYYDAMTSMIFQTVTNNPLENASALVIGGITVNSGNSAAKVGGIPIALTDKTGEGSYGIVYDSDSSEAKAAAYSLAALIEAKGSKAPEVTADNATSAVNEIVIGEADRAGVATLASYLAEESKLNPDLHWWAATYKDGKLYILAEDELGYTAAFKHISDNMFVDGELVAGSELLIAKGRSDNEIFCDSLVDPNPHEAYMSYETPDNFYEGYDDPFTGLYSDYKRMTLTLVDAKTYRISYADDRGGVFSADFVQKKWGMWMMGAMVYTDKNGTANKLTSSSTDYEFVLRCADEGSMTLRSGNHGDYTMDGWDATDTSKTNDRFLDMTFYDGRSGDMINLAVGESREVDGLRIVMHHNIYELDYSKEHVLINVEKSYLYNGYDVLFDAKLYMTKDVNFSTSYTCMLPISKQYGNCCMFYLEDGSTVYMKTPMSNTANETRMGVNSDHIDLWGENNPEYHITVDLFNPSHQLMCSDTEGKGYVGFREMLGGGSNKLYCSMFSSPGTLEHGAELNFKTRWAFSIQDDFVNPDREPDYWVGLPG